MSILLHFYICFRGYLTFTIITRPPGAEVYCAPVRATVHESSMAAAFARIVQREPGSSTVRTCEKLKR